MKRGSAPSRLRRFASAEIDPALVRDLAPDHTALVEGRTLFPSTVVGPLESPRFLVSGSNNPKLGKEVTKGDRAGWPIFHLSLEERATCPRSCAQWAACYGNAMHMARRHDHRSPDFLGLLAAEIGTVARQHPKGLLIRLHTLGDFYSVPYVLMWAEALLQFPQLHVFGYTARRIDDVGDPGSQKIAQAIDLLRRRFWNRFAIRTSHTEAGAERSIVVGEAVDLADVIMCPAQTKATEACATCGLCWAEAARPKTIAFLRHGMKRRGPSAPVRVIVPAEKRATRERSAPQGHGRLAAQIMADLPELYAEWPGGIPKSVLIKRYDATYYLVERALTGLRTEGEVQVLHPLDQKGKVVLPKGAKLPPPGLSEKQAAVFNALRAAADPEGIVKIGARELCERAGCSRGGIIALKDALVRKGYIREIERGVGSACSTWLVHAPEGARLSEPAPEPNPSAAPLRQDPATTSEIAGAAEEVAREPIGHDESLSPAGPRPWLQRRAGECAWPVSGEGVDLISCCAPCGDGTYCKKHRAAAYVGKKRA